MDKVVVHFNSTLPHFIQVFAGLEFLRDKGFIAIEYRLELHRYPVNILKITYRDHTFFLDMADSSDINSRCYEEADVYVKRMLLQSDYEINNKLQPFGLNYLVFYPNSFLKKAFLKDCRLIKYSLRFSRVASQIFNVRGCIKNNELQLMHGDPVAQKQILFRTRLWDPEKNSVQWKKEEREKLNLQRITINRLLQENYNAAFKGGIEKDKLALKQCPDLLLSQKEYHKKSFVNLLKNSSIGISNRGLEGSIGWKFGEYVAHSMAIVTTPIAKYKLLGPLTEGENYLVYKNENECKDKVDRLFSKDGVRLEMQKANRYYYEEFLHPGKKMMNILNMVL